MNNYQQTAFNAPCRVAEDCAQTKYGHRHEPKYSVLITLNVGLE